MADGLGMAVGAGAGSGAIKGLALGANPLLMGATGGLSAPIGAGLGAIIGGVSAGKKRQDVNLAMVIAMEDPEERAMQRFFARRKRAYLTGTANNADRTALRQGVQSGITNAFKYGATTRGLNSLSQMYQQGLMGLNAQGMQGALQYGAQENATTNNMVQRRLELALLKASQKSAEASQQTTEDKQNAGVGLMGAFDQIGSGMEMTKRKKLANTITSQVADPSGNTGGGLTNVMGDWQTPITSNLPTLE